MKHCQRERQLQLNDHRRFSTATRHDIRRADLALYLIALSFKMRFDWRV
jgi:hypothetical protein